MTTPHIRQLAATALLLATFLAAPMTGHAGRTMAKPPTNPTATPVPTATTVPCSTCPNMYVDTLNIAAFADNYSRTLGAGCIVTVRDEAGNWVEGALVTVRWGGQLSGTVSGLTARTGDEIGYAEVSFYNSVTGRCRAGDTKISTCTVTNVYKDGMAYDLTQNVVVTDSNDHCRL